MNLGAFNNDSNLKDLLVSESVEHRLRDRYQRGTFGDLSDDIDDFRGCTVGCSIRTLNDKLGAGIAGLGSHQGLAEYDERELADAEHKYIN